MFEVWLSVSKAAVPPVAVLIIMIVHHSDAYLIWVGLTATPSLHLLIVFRIALVANVRTVAGLV